MTRTLWHLFYSCFLIFCAAPLHAQDYSCAEGKIARFVSNRAVNAVNGQEKFDMKFIKLDVILTNQSNFISGNVFYKIKATQNLSDLVLELHNALTVDSVKINNAVIVFNRNGDLVNIPVNFNPNTDFEAQIFYHGNPPNSGFFNGFTNASSPSWGNKVSWSLSEPNNAMHWFPCKQSLTDKFDSSVVWITCDTSLKAGSNGLLKNITTFGKNHRFEWHYNLPIAYYLISVSCTEYIDYSYMVNIPGITSPVLVQNYIYNNPNTLPFFKSEIDKTGDMLKVFSKMYGPYPFWKMKYGHCMAPLSGGMEHNTMTTLGSFNTDLTSHELAHQWWGDHVTCKSWKDIWVNEGFARYSEYVYRESFDSISARSKMDAFHKSALSKSDGRTYVTDTINPSVIFDGRLTYDKGACIIHALRFELASDSLFFKICRTYQQTYSNKTAGVAEFKKVAEQLSGKDFSQFFNQWYYGQGYPTFHLRYKKVGTQIIVQIKEKVSAELYTPLFYTALQIKVIGKVQKQLYRVNISKDSSVFVFPFADSIRDILVDPNQWILNDTGTLQEDTSLKMPINVVKNTSKNKNILQVSPNPASDFLYINTSLQNYTIEVADMHGRVVMKAVNSPGILQIRELKTGIYVLNVSTGLCRMSTKFYSIKN